MTSQYYPFTGDERQSMAFTPVLDGTVYNCQLKWNITAQRWYLLITDSSGNTILNTVDESNPCALTCLFVGQMAVDSPPQSV